MPAVPVVEAIAPIVLVPGEKFVATADLRPLLPTNPAGDLVESIVSVAEVSVSPATPLVVSSAGEAVFDSTSIAVWLDATSTVHHTAFRVRITFTTRAADGPSDGSEDRTRVALCRVLVRDRDHL